MERLKRTVENIVSKDPDVMVPAWKVYLKIKYEHPEVKLLSFPEFVGVLKRSRKFEVIDVYPGLELSGFSDEVEKLLFDLGIYSLNPMVMLKGKKLTPAVMIKALWRNYRRVRSGVFKLMSGSETEVSLELASLLVWFRLSIENICELLNNMDFKRKTKFLKRYEIRRGGNKKRKA